MPKDDSIEKLLNEAVHKCEISESKCASIIDMMKMLPTVDEYGNFSHGQSKEIGLLLTAAIQNKKIGKYEVNPTILEPDEFVKYLDAIKESNKFPVKEKFIVAGRHWFAGEIYIEGHGKPPKILFVDSVGNNSSHTEIALPLAMIRFKDVFSDGELYVNVRQRQFSPLGCLVFAVDDMRHLFTVEKFLPDGEKNLLDYVTKNVVSEDNYEGFVTHNVKLPLSLMRSTQSSILFKDKQTSSYMSEYLNTETSIPLGKGKPTATQLNEQFRAAGDHFTDVMGKRATRNKRLVDKLRGMTQDTLNYLLRVDEKTVRQSMEALTFNGFKDRIGAAQQVLTISEVENTTKPQT